MISMKWVEANPDVNGFGGGGGPEWIEVSIIVTLMIFMSELMRAGKHRSLDQRCR